jgi:hypothetical protein
MEEPPIGCEAAKVASAKKPATAIPGVGAKHTLVQLRPPPVTGKEVLAPDYDLADLAGANRSAVSVDKQYLHVRYRIAYRNHIVDQFGLIVVHRLPIVERLCRSKAYEELAVLRKVLPPHTPLSACYCLASQANQPNIVETPPPREMVA